MVSEPLTLTPRPAREDLNEARVLDDRRDDDDRGGDLGELETRSGEVDLIVRRVLGGLTGGPSETSGGGDAGDEKELRSSTEWCRRCFGAVSMWTSIDAWRSCCVSERPPATAMNSW